MSATNYFETSILGLIFNGTTIDNIANNASASPATNLYISLHTADPGEAGNQTTSECNYTSYARVPIPRSPSGFVVAGNTAKNNEIVTFPTCTGGTNVITHFGIGQDPTGNGVLLFTGTLQASLSISNGITPEFRNENLTVTAD